MAATSIDDDTMAMKCKFIELQIGLLPKGIINALNTLIDIRNPFQWWSKWKKGNKAGERERARQARNTLDSCVE